MPRVLFVAPECFPLVKTGGLADVVGALPGALAPLGIDAQVMLPAYTRTHDDRTVLDHLVARTPVAAWRDLFGGPADLVRGRTHDGLTVLALDAPHLYARAEGGPYLDGGGHDWPDNHRRFAALCWAAADVARGALEDWRPDVVHAHDWQAGLVPAYLRLGPQPAPPVVLTVHNLMYQGLFPHASLGELRLPASCFTIDGLEYHGRISLLKAGVVYGEHTTTVSPTYAREIRAPEDGMGFDGLMRLRDDQGRLSGIVNGLDTAVWNPETDPALPPECRYARDSVEGKARAKARIQDELGLKVGEDPFLMCLVTRLTCNKGIDLLLDALPALLTDLPGVLRSRGGCQVAVLGVGEPEIEESLRRAVEDASVRVPGHLSVTLAHDEGLAHRLQAGADAILLPSRFEPCGLTQLAGMRYGTLPVAARTGGLADTVTDTNAETLRDGTATGFTFPRGSASGFLMAVARAMGLRRRRRLWEQVRHQAMSRDVGWGPSASTYAGLYASLLDGV